MVRDFAGKLLVGRLVWCLREFREVVLGALVGPVVEGTLGVLGALVGPVVDVGPAVDEGKGVWLDHEEEDMSALGDVRGGIGALDMMITLGKGRRIEEVGGAVEPPR